MTQLTFKTMTELNTQTQVIELTDDQLELVEGGGWKTKLFKDHVAKPVIEHALKRFFG